MHRQRTRTRGNAGCTRRTFLQFTAALGAFSVFPGPGLRAAADDVNRRAIPVSGERIPVIGLGTARTFNTNPSDTAAMEPLRGVLEAFYRGGGRLVDSSPMYGHAERVVGQLAGDLGIADELFMATKVWTRGRDDGIAQMERSRERMGGGRLDLIQVHNLVDLETHLETLQAWREEERVRYIGVTHSRTSQHDELARIVERYPIDFVQLNYNIAERNAEARLLPAAADNGVAVLVNEPFERGTLFRATRDRPLPDWVEELGVASWAQFFLKFIVGHPAVTCAIPATSNPDHSTDNIGACRGPLPDADQRARMARHFQEL